MFKEHCKRNIATDSNARMLPQFLIAQHYDQTGRVEDDDYSSSSESDSSDEIIFPCLGAEHRRRRIRVV